MKRQFIVPTHHTGQRLDALLAAIEPAIARHQWNKLAKAGRIMVNGVPAKPSTNLTAGDKIYVDLPDKPPVDLAVCQALPRLYENEHVVVVNKPPGLLTHDTGSLAKEITLLDIISAGMSGHLRRQPPQLVHRLDRETSGVIVVAKTSAAAQQLRQQFKQRTVHKHYRAIVAGRIPHHNARLEWPLARSRKQPGLFTIHPEGKPAITKVQLHQYRANTTSLDVVPLTGRTHQIRVHLRHWGYPVIGDYAYGNARPPARLMLHALALTIRLPGYNRSQTFTAPLPAEFNEFG